MAFGADEDKELETFLASFQPAKLSILSPTMILWNYRSQQSTVMPQLSVSMPVILLPCLRLT